MKACTAFPNDSRLGVVVQELMFFAEKHTCDAQDMLEQLLYHLDQNGVDLETIEQSAAELING